MGANALIMTRNKNISEKDSFDNRLCPGICFEYKQLYDSPLKNDI